MPLRVPIPPGHVDTIGIELKDHFIPSTGESIVKVYRIAANSPLRDSVKAGFILRDVKVRDDSLSHHSAIDAMKFIHLLAKHSSNPSRQLVFDIPTTITASSNQASQKDLGDVLPFRRRKRGDTMDIIEDKPRAKMDIYKDDYDKGSKQKDFGDVSPFRRLKRGVTMDIIIETVTLRSNDDEDFKLPQEVAKLSGYVQENIEKGSKIIEFLLASSDSLKLIVEFLNYYERAPFKISWDDILSIRKDRYKYITKCQSLSDDSCYFDFLDKMDEETIRHVYRLAHNYDIEPLNLLTRLKIEAEGWLEQREERVTDENRWEGPYYNTWLTKKEWIEHYISDIRKRKADKLTEKEKQEIDEKAKEELDKKISLRHQDKRYNARERYVAVNRYERSVDNSNRKTIEKDIKKNKKIANKHKGGKIIDLKLTKDAYTQDEVYDRIYAKANRAYRFAHPPYAPKPLPKALGKQHWLEVKVLNKNGENIALKYLNGIEPFVKRPKESLKYLNGTKPFVRNNFLVDKLERAWKVWFAFNLEEKAISANKEAVKILHFRNDCEGLARVPNITEGSILITNKGHQDLMDFLAVFETIPEMLIPKDKNARR